MTVIVVLVLVLIIITYSVYSYYTKYTIYSKNAIIIDKMPSTISNRIDSESIINPKLGNSYTLSFWIYLDTIYYNSNYWRHVFHRGTNVESKILNYEYWNNVTRDIPEQCMGLWFHPNINNMRLSITNHKEEIEYVDIDDIPSKTLVHFTFVLKNQILSVWRDGKLYLTKGLSEVPYMSIKSMFFNYQNTYAGKLYNFMYIPRELNYKDIYYLYKNKKPSI